MALFTKAAAKKESAKASSPKKKSTTWRVGDPEGDAVAKAVHLLVDLEAQSKALEAKMSLQKTVVWNHANRQFIADYCEIGAPPETPMKVVNSDGEEVTFVVQDRSGQYGLKEEQIDQLGQLLGEDKAQEILYTETSFGFNRDVLAHPGVQDVVEKALEAAVKKLIKDGVLDEDQAEAMIEAKQKTTFRPGTYQQLASIAGRDTGKMKDFLDIAGSSVCRYVKP
jgi:hypothetical protein